MKAPRGALVGGIVVLAAVLGWVLFVGLPRWVTTSRTPAAAPAPVASAAEPERKIQARLFYVAEDGHGLTSVEQDVTYGANPGAQARAILDAQTAPPAAPLVSAIPPGVKVRAVFVTNGEAYVDMTSELVTAHPGGSLNEQLTVHTLVAAITTNLPAVTRVQILVEGKEVDTLAGHVDLREPLTPNPEWVR